MKLLLFLSFSIKCKDDSINFASTMKTCWLATECWEGYWLYISSNKRLLNIIILVYLSVCRKVSCQWNEHIHLDFKHFSLIIWSWVVPVISTLCYNQLQNVSFSQMKFHYYVASSKAWSLLRTYILSIVHPFFNVPMQ